MGEIIIVGLGPGPWGMVSLETWEIIQQASILLLRTAKHPTVSELTARGVEFVSYDSIYDEQETFDDVYQMIASDCLQRAERGEKLVYAVPGSPLVAERTVMLIREQALERDITIRILPGMSFLEVLYVRLGIDPVTGITIIDAADIPALSPKHNLALVVTQLYNRQVASEAKISLMEFFGDEHPVTLVRNLGLPDEEILTVPLFELDRLAMIDHLTSLYIAPQQPKKAVQFQLDPVIDIMARLRSPGGCVWDIEQTHVSLRRYVIEEVHEVIEAIDLQDSGKLCDELGDLLLQIVFHARIAEECGEFTMQDVVNGVTEKLIRRHPHVFGDISVRDAAEVVTNWDAIKKREKAHEGRTSVLDGIPAGFPALMRAQKLQSKAAKVGFDWSDDGPVWDKLREELEELCVAVAGKDKQDIEGELGDVLFSVVNLARFLGIESEVALNGTNRKFIRRFAFIEKYVQEQNLKWADLNLEQLDKLWEIAKKSEKG